MCLNMYRTFGLENYWKLQHTAYTKEASRLFLQTLDRLRDDAVAISWVNLPSRIPGQLRIFLILSTTFSLVLLLLYGAYTRQARENRVLPRTREVLLSLYAVLTPTQSFWPPQYLSLARSTAKANNKIISISLSTLYRDLLDDVVELRCPKEDLPLLFLDKLLVPTQISLDVDSFWWVKLLWWMFSCHVRNKRTQLTPITKHEEANTSLQDSQLPPPPPYPKATQEPLDINSACACAPPSTLFFSMLYENAPSVSLDCVPYRTLEASVRSFQRSLDPGAYLTIGLTTRAGAAKTFFNPKTILTAIPFLPRQYLSHRRGNDSSGGGERTTTPLFVTLPRVLALLTSGPTPLTIELARNVSEEYAKFLHRSVRDLEEDREIRGAFVREWGVVAWREERVCTAWEAALLGAGLLEGWAVVVRR
ncbi:hypothetical protein C8Q79DRAFT_1118412 [Trametes meyenii]|nr:hypothetical protein C8Q79DRAFT_1118412 [Trametes meyenii]